MPYQITMPDVAPNLDTWRYWVKLKDDYTCQGCFTKSYNNGIVKAHHILTRRTRPDLELVISNGKVVCARCHGIAHNRIEEDRRKILLDYPTEYLSTSETAKVFNLSVSDIGNCRKRYGLTGRKIVGRWYYHKDDLARVIDIFNNRPDSGYTII